MFSMTLFMHRITKCLAVGGIVVASAVGLINPAQALTEEQVVEQLLPVPVFTIVDGDGVIIVAEVQGEEDTAPVAPVFINRDDAERFLASIQNSDSDLPADIRVKLESLGVIYAYSRQEQESETSLEFEYVPSPDEQQSAVNILQDQLERQGEDPSEISRFPGVPLFVACRGDGDCLPPFFFSFNEFQSEFQSFVDQASEENSQAIQEFGPSVISLEYYIGVLEDAENVEDLSEFRLVPSMETRQEVRERVQEAAESEAQDPEAQDPEAQ